MCEYLSQPAPAQLEIMLPWKEPKVTLFVLFIGLIAAPGSSSQQERRRKTCTEKPPQLDPLLQHVEDIGAFYSGDSGVPLGERPPWLDVSLLRAGQKFARDNLASVFLTEFQGLYLLFTLQYELGPMIFSGASDTPEKAFFRYRSTVFRVLSWYDTDLLDTNSEAFRNLAAVRSLHANMRNQTNSVTPEEYAERTKIKGGMWCPMTSRLRRDFAESICPYRSTSKYQGYKELHMSQKAMAYTQFGFVGLAFAFPREYGMNPSKRDFQGFAHLWAFIGHQLGIRDEFNLCLGEISQVEKRMKQFVEYIAKPHLANIRPEWEHMARCMADGISKLSPLVSFPVGLKKLLETLRIDSPSLDASLTPTQRTTWMLTENLQEAQKRGQFRPQSMNNFIRFMLNVSKNITVAPRPPPRPGDCPEENFVR